MIAECVPLPPTAQASIRPPAGVARALRARAQKSRLLVDPDRPAAGRRLLCGKRGVPRQRHSHGNASGGPECQDEPAALDSSPRRGRGRRNRGRRARDPCDPFTTQAPGPSPATGSAVRPARGHRIAASRLIRIGPPRADGSCVGNGVCRGSGTRTGTRPVAPSARTSLRRWTQVHAAGEDAAIGVAGRVIRATRLPHRHQDQAPPPEAPRVPRPAAPPAGSIDPNRCAPYSRHRAHEPMLQALPFRG